MPASIVNLDSVLDNLADHAVFRLDEDGNVLTWNKAAERTKGYTASDIVGKHFRVFYTGEDQQAGVPENALAIARTTGHFETAGWRVRKDGSRFWAEVVIQPTSTPDGTMHGFVKVTRNIDQRLALEKLREELQQSQKLDLVGQLTGGIAHDFNNLLTAIESTYELVRLSAKNERIDRYLSVNRVAIDRSRKLIGQLLAFSRKQIMHPQLLNLNDIVSVFDELLQRAVGDPISITWQLGRNLPYANFDGAHLQSALMNLVINARDAMPNGGELKIFSGVRDVPPGAFEAPYDVPPGVYLAIGVTDTGTGMSDDVVAHCVEPFFTTKEIGKGTGLGLSQCFGFARQSGGTLSIKSVAGKGTAVVILLPVAHDISVSTDPQRTILLVEDDPAVRELAAELLRTLGNIVIEASDAPEALSLLQHDLSIDLLFTDIMMPNGINGFELLVRARELRPGLPVVLTSGYTQNLKLGDGLVPQDAPFLRKPYTLEDLRESLRGRQVSQHVH